MEESEQSDVQDVKAEETGEELYARARLIPHHLIPDFTSDGAYLALLGESAAKGYPKALAKLGHYAMRRKAWVEAYYWMKRAERAGMPDLTDSLCEIRQCWVRMRYPNQMSNIHELFSEEAGSIGRALLGIDSRHDAQAAREFLKDHHPQFLDGCEK